MAASIPGRGRARSEPALFPPSVHTFVGTGSLCLSDEQHWSKRAWSRSPVWSGGLCWASPGKLARAPVFNLLFCPVTGSQQVCVQALQEQSLGFLLASSKSRLFSNSYGGSSSRCQPQGLGCLIYGLNPCSPEKILEPVISPSSSGSHASGVGTNQTVFPSFLPDSVWLFFYSLGCRRAVLLVLRWIPARVTLYVAVVLMCS